ncbi:hypothetical protein [Exiguobacterium qingdaonense]|uniref:hypothetical protein n=1 Tax=Exiguobacterium qingdaonense TaxID=2751251 RepID=UPI001BE7E75B|nr:hypothetical protein [Exiguobacterium qingdaonense]
MRKYSMVSVILFFIVEYIWLNQLFDSVNERLLDGKWTNTILYQVVVEPDGLLTLLLVLFVALLLVGWGVHYVYANKKSWLYTSEHIGVGWFVPLFLAVLGLLISDVYVQVAVLLLQLTFIPLIPFIHQTVPFWKVLTNWTIQLAVIGLVLYGGRGMLEDSIRIEKTELFTKLEAYQASGDLDRIQRLVEEVDLEQVERVLDRVDIEQLIRILEVVDLDRIEQILSLFS